jgi:type I restriction enzyme S subunit
MLFQNGFNSGSAAYGSGIALISVMDILGNNYITYSMIRGKAQLKPDEAKRYSVEFGDVLFQRSSENFEDAGRSNVYLDTSNNAIFGGFVIRGKKIADYNPMFMKHLLDTTSIRLQVISKAQGAQHINVTQETLLDVQVYMPSISEQQIVGDYFFHLDRLTTLQQRALDKLKTLKKAFLEKMFV